jgi:5-methylcytosine-specific restriction endonuclease McrBC regulatory subunit McrC
VINVAELFEIYISKLLKKEFKDWLIDSPVIRTYQDQFFKRRIIPDIVMQRGKDVIVFDTKYKRMRMIGSEYSSSMGDVDRSDFFQINTYMSYYNNQGLNVLLGGLLYPMDEFDQSRCHSDGWFGNSNTKFIVDGVEVSSDGIDDFSSVETKFINRMSQLLP